MGFSDWTAVAVCCVALATFCINCFRSANRHLPTRTPSPLKDPAPGPPLLGFHMPEILVLQKGLPSACLSQLLPVCQSAVGQTGYGSRHLWASLHAPDHPGLTLAPVLKYLHQVLVVLAQCISFWLTLIECDLFVHYHIQHTLHVRAKIIKVLTLFTIQFGVQTPVHGQYLSMSSQNSTNPWRSGSMT